MREEETDREATVDELLARDGDDCLPAPVGIAGGGRGRLLADAMLAVEERAGSYGDVEDCFERVARLWTAYGCAIGGEALEARDVANMMVLLKVARNDRAGHRDNWVDMAGYAACGAEVDE